MWHWEFQYGCVFPRKFLDKRKHRCGICSYSFHDPAVVWYGVAILLYHVDRYADNNMPGDFRKPTWSACVRNIVQWRNMHASKYAFESAFLSLWQSWNCFNSKYCVAKPKPTFRRFEIYSFNYQTNVTFPLVILLTYQIHFLLMNIVVRSNVLSKKEKGEFTPKCCIGMRPPRGPVIFRRTLHYTTSWRAVYIYSQERLKKVPSRA